MREEKSIKEVQAEMNEHFAGGATGVLVSGCIWLLCSVAANLYPAKHAIWMLLIGGALIHPLSFILGKLMGIKGKPSSGNALSKLAIEGTLFMIFCIPLAYGYASQQPELFFFGMMLIVGGRYLIFSTVYGNKIYWLLGFAIAMTAYILFKSEASIVVIALTMGIIECCFGLFILLDYKKNI